MIIKDNFEGAATCENYLWRYRSVSSDHRFATLHKGLALSPYFFGLIIDE